MTKRQRENIQAFKRNRRRRARARRARRRFRWIPPPPFSVMAEYKGFDGARDKAIAKAAGRKHSDGSGFGFLSETRDLEFGFKTRRSAIAAAKRVNALRGVKAIVTGRVWP